jgi:methylated-DNA-[protein]-cysteine S-methyltransferase
MMNQREQIENQVSEQVINAVGIPPEEALAQSRRRVIEWFAQAAPLIQWDVIESPLGPIYAAASAKGVCSVEFGVSADAFLDSLDPLACTEWNPAALAAVTGQLREYFSGARSHIDLPVDLARLTPFQKKVLQTARRIPPGTVWTYGQMARTIGKPRASRAVGQALGRNPVPIVIPCHRVIAGDGSLGGYSGGGGLKSKRLLLHIEGAL